MGGRYDPALLGLDSYIFINVEKIDSDISKKVKLSYKRYFKYLEDDQFIKNDELAKYKRKWMSEALKRVPEHLLKHDEQLVRDIFHEIFSDYRYAIRKAIMDYVLRCPEERKRLYIDLLIRECPTSMERICNAGGYSILLYNDWHNYVEESRMFLQNNLYAMNIVNSSILDWFNDFQGINMVESNLTKFMAVKGYAMKIETFIKVQRLHRNQTYAFFKNIWLRGVYLIMKKFKYFRIHKERKGSWTYVGYSFDGYTQNDFLETITEMSVKVKGDETDDIPETVFNVLMCGLMENLANGIDMPLTSWSNIQFDDLHDIRDCSAYNYHAMVNKEPVLLEENGYKLLDKEVRKNLRRSVGVILSLQLREKIS